MIGKRKEIKYSNPYKINNEGGHSYWESALVEIRDGTGYFEIRNLWEGILKIQAAHVQKQLDIDDPIEGIVIDLQPESAPEELPTRTVIFRFDIPEGAAPPSGSLRAGYLKKDFEHNFLEMKLIPIEDGEAKLEVPVPGKTFYRPDATVGYWFKEGEHIDVPEGDSPFIVDIHAVPAGSCYGRVLLTNGEPALDISITPTIAEKSPFMEHAILDIQSLRTSAVDGTFNASPLPLGGKYAIVAHIKNRYAVSEPFLLTNKEPTQEVTLQFVEGVSVTGRVTDTEGNPISTIELHPGYSSPYHHSFGFVNLFTDNEGRFKLENLNPDVPGHYTLRIPCRKDYRPKHIEFETSDSPLTIRLEKGYTVEGKVIEAESGYPVPGVEVYAIASPYDNMPTAEAESTTNEDGFFRFSNLGQGKYRLNTRNSKLVGPREEHEVSGGQEESVSLEIEIYEWSELKPSMPDS